MPPHLVDAAAERGIGVLRLYGSTEVLVGTWNRPTSSLSQRRHTDGAAMLREIRQLGFEYAELSHGVRISLLPGILQAVDAGEIKISSLHNFCPLPMGVEHAAPNIFKFTADNPRERENAYMSRG